MLGGNLESSGTLPLTSLVLKFPASPKSVAVFQCVHIYLLMYLFFPRCQKAFGLTTSKIGMSIKASLNIQFVMYEEMKKVRNVALVTPQKL